MKQSAVIDRLDRAVEEADRRISVLENGTSPSVYSVNNGGITLQSGHLQNDSTNFPVMAERDYTGRVDLAGSVDMSSASAQTIFTLPVGLRPATSRVQRCVFAGHDASAESDLFIQIDPDGTVKVDATLVSVGVVYIDSVSFMSSQSI